MDFFKQLQSTLKSIGLLIFVLMGVSSWAGLAFADGAPSNIPGIDIDEKAFAVPENLAQMSTREITELLDTHKEDLNKIREIDHSEELAEQQMFEELIRHDDVRISIADVIPELIEEYEIEGEFKDKLLGYRSTFSVDLVESRGNVESLKDYGSYDFRFSAVYMSMLFSFQEHPEFYEKLKVDMVDEDSLIGEYRRRLDKSFKQVERARAQVEGVKNTQALENLIAELDQELARRGD